MSARKSSNGKPQPYEPIAIVGMGCRFPGDAVDPDSFWDLLCEGRDAVTDVPADRWNPDTYYHPDVGVPGHTYSRWGGFVRGMEEFDPGFFGISPREAVSIDPQQRAVLQATAEACEDGGIPIDSLRGSLTGVYIGVSTYDYSTIQPEWFDKSNIDIYTATGGAKSIVANRVSYCLDLKGPSFIVDTACSSALVALHAACRGIRAGDCEMAVVGGVNYLLTPDNFIAFARMGILSPHGRCRAFAADASGFVRSEGVGVVMLKPLARAVEDDNLIYAVIRGTSVNQDGRTSGIALPNQKSQEAAIRAALKDAAVAPEDVQYVEAHGTGTPVGDPIEAMALSDVLCTNRPEGSDCVIGSVKTNIGHLESAAGIAGLIKLALVLKHGTIPPILHFKKPNPNIPFSELKLRVADREMEFPNGDAKRIGGINSFGFGGTNAHAILEAAMPCRKATDGEIRTPHLLPISAHSSAALRGLAARYLDFLQSDAGRETRLKDIIHSLALRRSHWENRVAIVAESHDEAVEKLEAFIGDEGRPGLCTRDAELSEPTNGVVFTYTGQGPQWWAMGRQLYHGEPVFRQKIEECDRLLEQLAPWSLCDELLADEEESRIHDPAIGQPAIFAVQVALTALWESWGITPSAVVGHSVGEVAAAHVAGSLSLPDALRVIYHRGRSMALAPHGGMLVAGGTKQQAEDWIDQLGIEDIWLAAHNSPNSVSLAGTADAVKEMTAELEGRDVFARTLEIHYAFHTPLMDGIRDDLLESLEGLEPGETHLPFYSSVTGECLEGTQHGAEYWWDNIRQPVSFREAVDGIIEAGHRAFLEVGPHPALSGYVTECLRSKGRYGCTLPSLRRQEDERRTILESLGNLHALGEQLDWATVAPEGGRFVRLPLMAWQSEHYWSESDESRMARTSPPPHPLLGRRQRAVDPTWEARINTSAVKWLGDHLIRDRVVYPAAGYLELALAAGAELFDGAPCTVEDVQIRKALFVGDSDVGPRLQFVYCPDDRSYTINSQAGASDDGWIPYSAGFLRRAHQPRRRKIDIQRRIDKMVPMDSIWYDVLAEHGLNLGPSFRGIKELHFGRAGEVIAHVETEFPESQLKRYRAHPAILDGAFQTLIAVVEMGDIHSRLYLPVEMGRLRFYKPLPNEVWCVSKLTRQTDRMIQGNMLLVDEDGEVCVDVEGYRCQAVGEKSDGSGDRLYRNQWRFSPLPEQGFRCRPSDYLRSPKQLAQHAAKRMRQEGLEQRPRPDLKSLCTAWLHRAAQGVETTNAEHPDADGPYRQRLAAFLSNGKPRGAESSPESIGRARVLAHPGLTSEITLISAWGKALPDILRGTSSIEQFLAADDVADLLGQIRRNGADYRTGNLLVAEVLATALEKLPPGRRIRILEANAGTGGITSSVLPHLPADQVEYVFTDPSPQNVERAQTSFREYAFVRCEPFDCAQADAAQPFDHGSFDMVIASQGADADFWGVLHKFLAPGGLLVAVNMLEPDAWESFICGVQPAAPAAERLQQAGFKHVTKLDGTGEREVLLAQKSRAKSKAKKAAPPPPLADKVVLIYADAQGVGEQLATQIRAGGARCVLVQPGKELCKINDERYQIRPSATADVEELIADVEPTLVIHGWALDSVPPAEMTVESLMDDEERCCHSLLALTQTLTEGSDMPPRAVVLTRGAQSAEEDVAGEVAVAQGSVIGMVRVIQNEHPELRCRSIDLCPTAPAELEISAIYDELAANDAEPEVILRGEARYAARFVRTGFGREKPAVSGPARKTPYTLEARQPGVVDALGFSPRQRRRPRHGEAEIEVLAAGLNFRDVMKALGIYPAEADDALLLGDECAGRIVAVGPGVEGLKRGDEVVAIAPGGFSSHVTIPAEFVIPKTPQLSAEEAVTVPITFLTAWYALKHMARTEAGERVLIHAATGGVGLAAVQIAQCLGAEVFATAGSPRKRDFLRMMGVKHVMDSRSLKFVDEILSITKNEGIDVVLNSLAGEAIPGSLGTLRPYGRFLEIGKRDIYENSKLGLRPFRNNLSWFAIDLAQTMRDRPRLIKGLLDELWELFGKGKLAPLPHRVIPLSQAGQAFRHMAQAGHIGKVVLSSRLDRVTVSEPQPRDAIASIEPEATYLVSGGIRGFGFETAQWLAFRGARYLVVVSRSGAASEEDQANMAALEELGAEVLPLAADVSKAEDVQRVLDEVKARKWPKLRGVVHAAMVLDDAFLRQLTPERFRAVMAPKVHGAWNLHQATLDCPLDMFVMFSSIAATMGNPGQGNYAAANAFLDSLADYRTAQGLPALAVNWGQLSSAGYVSRNERIAEHLDRSGFTGMDPPEAMFVLDRLLAQNKSRAVAAHIDWQRLSKAFISLARSPRFADMVAAESGGSDNGDGAAFRAAVLAASPEERRSLIEGCLRETIAKVLRTSPSRLDVDKPLNALGLDSLMAVELVYRLESQLGTTIPPGKLTANISIKKITVQVLELLTAVDSGDQQSLQAMVMGATGEPDAKEAGGPEVGAADDNGTAEMIEQLDEFTLEDVDEMIDDRARRDAQPVGGSST